MVSIEELREKLRYDAETGRLFWRHRLGQTKGDRGFNRRFSGKEAFTYLGPDGYLLGTVYPSTALRAHRVAWAIVHGEWPEGIDHINGDRADNRLSNLRAATKASNAQNQKKRSDNTSGVMGVSWAAKNKKWRVRIQKDGKRVDLGLFNDLLDAKAAKKSAEKQMSFGPNHNS